MTAETTAPSAEAIDAALAAGDTAGQCAGFAGAPRRGQAVSRSGERSVPGWLWPRLAPAPSAIVSRRIGPAGWR